MKRAKTVRSEVEHARIETEIGRILATEEELMPFSGFVASVMDRVRQEAALPAPIPFPWKRAILILLLASGAVGWGAVELVRLGLTGLGLTGLSQLGLNWLTIFPQHLSADVVRSVEEAGWGGVGPGGRGRGVEGERRGV